MVGSHLFFENYMPLLQAFELGCTLLQVFGKKITYNSDSGWEILWRIAAHILGLGTGTLYPLLSTASLIEFFFSTSTANFGT